MPLITLSTIRRVTTKWPKYHVNQIKNIDGFEVRTMTIEMNSQFENFPPFSSSKRVILFLTNRKNVRKKRDRVNTIREKRLFYSWIQHRSKLAKCDLTFFYLTRSPRNFEVRSHDSFSESLSASDHFLSSITIFEANCALFLIKMANTAQYKFTSLQCNVKVIFTLDSNYQTSFLLSTLYARLKATVWRKENRSILKYKHRTRLLTIYIIK